MKHFLGIDCGGSSTRACVIDANGEIVFKGESGPANLASTPQLELEQHLADALHGSPEVSAGVACFAGLLTDADRHRALAILEKVLPGPKLAAFPDYYAALADSTTDVALIAGTGSLAASRNERGEVIKSGGGGPLLGDSGSAFDLGRRALGRTLLLADPQPASPLFWEAVVELFGSREPNQILAAIYRSVSPAARVAKLAPTIVFDALRGLPYASHSLGEVLQALAQLLHGHIEAHLKDRDPVNVRLAGGLWDIEDVLTERFQQVCLDLSPGGVGPEIIIERLTREPVLGAAQMARELADQSGL